MTIKTSLLLLFFLGVGKTLTLAPSKTSDAPASMPFAVATTVLNHHDKMFPLSPPAPRQLQKCPPGSVGITPSCIPCPPGTFSFGSDGCDPCPSGFYQDQQGQTDCVPCLFTQLYSGEGANAALLINGDEVYCLLIRTTPSSAPSMQPSRPPTVNPTNLPSSEPSMSSSPSTPPSLRPSLLPTTTAKPSWEPSLSPTEELALLNVSLADSAALTCTNGTFTYHGACTDCPSSRQQAYSLTLAYALFLLLLSLLVGFCCPSYIFVCMDYLQSMGMLSLIHNLEWPYLVQQSHKHFFIWAALDWAGILALPCWGVSIHVVRLLSATLPLAIATLPLDISHIFLFLGCIRSYDAVEAFIDRYNNWSILVLLLYLPSVLVTIGDAIHCEGDTFCLSTDSWLERFVPPMVLCIGFCHVVWLSLGVFRRRQHNVSKNFVLRTFSYWWWPYEVILRKTVTVMTLFLLQGTKCLFLVVAVDVASSLLHVVLRVYGNDARPRIRRVVSGILFFSLLVFTFVAILYAELMNPRFHNQSYWATVFGIIALCLTLGSVSIGFLMYLCTKSKKEEKSEDEVDVDKKEDDLVEVPEQSLVVWPDDDAVEMCDIEKGKH